MSNCWVDARLGLVEDAPVRSPRVRTTSIVASLVASLALLSACGSKDAEQVAEQNKTEGAKVDPGQPTADANPETPVIAGEGELPNEPKPAEPKPSSDAQDQPPPAADEDDVEGEGEGEDDGEGEEEGDEEIDDREPPPYPKQAGDDPGPFVHPPAAAVLVVASTRSYSPGETAVDRDGKYHTWIWRPAAGPLPDKGKAEAPLGPDGVATGPALVEEFDGLIVADGTKLSQLILEEVTTELPKCTCNDDGEGGYTNTSRNVSKKLFEMRAQPLGPWEPGVPPTANGDAKVLIAATDFERESGMDCVTTSKDLEHVLQAHTIAGSRVFVVERVLDVAACRPEQTNYELRSQKLFDLADGSFDLAALERELPYKVVKRARTQASEELSLGSSASAYDLAPINLVLTAMFPKYREHRGGIRLLLQYSVEIDETEAGQGGWANGWDSHVITVAYPDSSSLTAPAHAMQLIEYVHREGGDKWKVIGWSQINAGEAAPPDQAPSDASPSPGEAPRPG